MCTCVHILVYKPGLQGHIAQPTYSSQASYCYKLPPNVSLQEGAMQLSDGISGAWGAPRGAWVQSLPSFSTGNSQGNRFISSH